MDGCEDIDVFLSGIGINPVPIVGMLIALCDDDTDLLHEVSDVAKARQSVEVLMLQLYDVAHQLVAHGQDGVWIVPAAIRPAHTLNGHKPRSMYM